MKTKQIIYGKTSTWKWNGKSKKGYAIIEAEHLDIMTIKEFNNLYKKTLSIKPPIIEKWKVPFLWILWFFIGYTTESENIKMYWLNFRGTKYLLKSKDLC
jgi:hypothetical protein